jgi:hypothetical protein
MTDVMFSSGYHASSRERVIAAVVRWTIFTVGFSVVSLAFAYSTTFLVGDGLSWPEFFSGGEVSLVAATLNFAAFGELVGRNNLVASRITQVVGQGLNALSGFVAALIFSLLLGVQASNGDLDALMAAQASIGAFGLSLITSVCCIALAADVRAG